MKNTLNSSALLLIDFQEGFKDEYYWGGNRNNKNAEEVAASLLAKWRELGWPVFHSQHASVNPKSPLHPSHPGHQFHSLLQPIAGEHVVVKNVNSAFIGTDLEQTLRSRTINSIVIAGLITNHCVSTTARMAGNLGFQPYGSCLRCDSYLRPPWG